MSEHFVEVSIDAVKDYWDRRPCNVRHSPKTIGTREYFDEVEARRYFVEPHIPAFAEFEKWRGKRVLEIGCGIGTETINFARAGATVVAVDISEESLRIARQRAAVYGLEPQIRFFAGNAEELGSVIPHETFDLVYSFGVIHHTPQPQRVIAALMPFLKPGSELRLMLYSRVSYKLFSIMHDQGPWNLSKLDDTIAKYSEAQTGCPVTYTYTDRSVRALLSGFDITEIRKAHIFTWDVEAYRNYEYRKDHAWEGVSDDELHELEKELGWHMLVRATLPGGN